MISARRQLLVIDLLERSADVEAVNIFCRLAAPFETRPVFVLFSDLGSVETEDVSQDQARTSMVVKRTSRLVTSQHGGVLR